MLEAWSFVTFDNDVEETFKHTATGHVSSKSRKVDTSTLGEEDLFDSTPHASKDNKITMMIEVK